MAERPSQEPLVQPFGDSAVLVVFGTTIEAALNARVHALVAAVDSARERGGSHWGVPIPAYASVLVPYDAEQWTYPEAADAMRGTLTAAAPWATQHGEEDSALEIPVRYGGASGPDLSHVAAHCRIEPDEVVALHTGGPYRVFMLGFAPGFAYCGPLPPALVVPRRATPRSRVPPGSVAIAASQTGIYPLATPGGWHLLGMTDLVLWDTQRDPPALLRPGQFVRFVAV